MKIDIVNEKERRRWALAMGAMNQAIPNLLHYRNHAVVVKLGGSVISDDSSLASFARDIMVMQQVGIKTVVVHGGAAMITEMLDRLNVKSEFVKGQRVTDEKTLQVVEMVLSGNINKRLVSVISSQGAKAIGLSGKDADLVVCEPKDPDLGFVGSPAKVNVDFMESLFDADLIPVIAPIGVGENRQTFNVNADTMAGFIAQSLKAYRLLLLTDVPGVKDASGNLISELTKSEVQGLIESGVIAGGMIPKTMTAVDAIDHGVEAAAIVYGRNPSACLQELFTNFGSGTLIRGK